MSELSPRLGLPFLLPAQAQKHVTHNEALEALDIVVHLTLEGVDAITPPVSRGTGQVWALGSGASGDWSGNDGRLAAWMGDAWQFITPLPGWCAAQGTTLYVWDGSTWQIAAPDSLNNMTGLGINASHDAVNRLALSSDASLFTHEGEGHQVKVNKASASDTASLLFQTNWSGRAEMGTAGNDDFSLKVSADGSLWRDAIVVDAASGVAGFPAGLTVDGTLSGTAVTQTATDTNADKLLKVGDFGLGATTPPAVTDLTTALAPGFYHIPDLANATGVPAGQTGVGTLLVLRAAPAGATFLLGLPVATGPSQGFWLGSRASATGAISWSKLWTSANTTVDANGFLREA